MNDLQLQQLVAQAIAEQRDAFANQVALLRAELAMVREELTALKAAAKPVIPSKRDKPVKAV